MQIVTTDYEFWTITAVFLGGSLMIALALEDLGLVLSVIGATGGTTVTFIFPGTSPTHAHTPPRACLNG
jgi:amino acid permease